VWDARRHPALTIENVRAVHAHELTRRGVVPNACYVQPAAYLRGRGQIALTPPPQAVVDIARGIRTSSELGPLRGELTAWAQTAGFAATAAQELVVAANEVLSNALAHGRPPVRTRGWRHGQTLVVQTDDAGGRPIRPQAGYEPPLALSQAYGLWVVRQLADVMTVFTVPQVRTSVRLYFPHDVTHRSMKMLDSQDGPPTR
jgi:anti-sigma regulatory factor (Ser/Thr protein kinase)